MTELELRIKEASQKYYTDGSSDMTDVEFDAAIAQLKFEQPDSELLLTGFGYSVDLDTTPGDKVAHRYGDIGSLEKAYSYSELPHSCRGRVLATLKLDGISVVVYYRDGRMYQALTRGKDNIGIDVTDKVEAFAPITIPDSTFTGAIRGEIVMSHKNFEVFKTRHPEAKNARNSTAGLVNGKGVTDDLKLLNVVFYQIVGDESYQGDASSYTPDYILRKIDSMYRYGCVVPYCIVEVSDEHFIDQMNSLKAEWYSTYPADGIVLTNSSSIDLDTRSVYYDAVAFKFDSEEKQTEVVDVEWRLTKTRYLMPRINLKSVELAGTTVSWATGYNAQYIRDNQIGQGAVVTVEKHGEIIPNINEVLQPATVCQLPTHCPDCNSQLIWAGVHLQCPNETCTNAYRKDLSVWIDNLAPVDGLGDAIRTKHLEAIFGQELSIERVMEYAGKTVYMAYGRGGHKQLMAHMLNTLYGNVADAKVPLAKALTALNIPRLGGITALKLAMFSDMVKALVHLDPSTESETFWADVAKAIGLANAQSIRAHSWKFKRLEYIENRIVWDTQKSATLESRGKVAITGKLSIKRSEFENQLKQFGYTPAEISKDTKFLITDDPNSSSSKNKKADQWGIVKITEKEFRENYMR